MKHLRDMVNSHLAVTTQTKPTSCTGCPLYDQPVCRQDGPPNADVLVIGGSPSEEEVRRGPFYSRSSSTARKILTGIANSMPPAQKPTFAWTYAAQCLAAGDKLPAQAVHHCKSRLYNTITRVKPRLVILLGADAMGAYDLKGKFGDYRGLFADRVIGDHQHKLLVTVHPSALYKRPGLLPVLENDLKKAIETTFVRAEEFEFALDTPTECSAIVSYLEKMKREILAEYSASGRKVPLAVDTETTSLIPQLGGERMIAVSLSHKEKYGLAFPYEHRESPYSPFEAALIRSALESVLSMPEAGIIMHNGKFDLQWMFHKYGLRMGPLAYDVMLGEHALNEDKKGEYSLKDLTRDRFPAMSKYEDALKEELDGIRRERCAEYKALMKSYMQSLQEAFSSKWLQLTEDERMSLLGKWVNEGHIKMSSDIMNLVVPQKIKSGALSKAYMRALGTLSRSVPLEDLEITMDTDILSEEEFTKVTFEDANLDSLLKYAAIDAMMTYMCYVDQQNDYRKDSDLIRTVQKKLGKALRTVPVAQAVKNLSMPLCPVLADMEYNGVMVDRDAIRGYQEIVQEGIKVQLDSMYNIIGRKFNPAGDDLAKILYEDLKFPILLTTETGQPSTAAEVIKDLTDEYNHPFLESLLFYRRMEKVQSTYLTAWLAQSATDSRIHCKFNQIGTATLRLSSSNPNLQNVPFMLRLPPGMSVPYLNLKSVFLPDSPDYELYDLDIANAEMRVLTAYSRDATMIEAFNNGKCLHCLTGAGISQFTYEDIYANKEDKSTPQYTIRQVSKKVNFGTIYCMAPITLKKRLWIDMRINVTEEEAASYLDGFFVTYPGTKTYIDSTQQFVKNFHFTFTYTGRRRRFPIIAYNASAANRVGRQAVNARIQTTSSDIVTTNLVDVNTAIKPRNGRMLLTVHDSLLFQLPKGETGVKKMLDEAVRDAVSVKFPWMPVEWKYDVAKGPTYGTCKEEVV